MMTGSIPCMCGIVDYMSKWRVFWSVSPSNLDLYKIIFVYGRNPENEDSFKNLLG